MDGCSVDGSGRVMDTPNKTLEYFIDIGVERGRGILWHELRKSFPHTKMERFEQNYEEVMKHVEPEKKKATLDDYNILGI